MLKVVKSRIAIPVFVMIRPRGGDFLYSQEEFEVMKEDVKTLKDVGADGMVFGILTRQVFYTSKRYKAKLLPLSHSPYRFMNVVLTNIGQLRITGRSFRLNQSVLVI